MVSVVRHGLNSQSTNRTGQRMQSEMKSAVTSPKDRYTASSVPVPAATPAAAYWKTVLVDGCATQASTTPLQIDGTTDKKIIWRRFCDATSNCRLNGMKNISFSSR